MRTNTAFLGSLALSLALSSCVTHGHVTEYHGVAGQRGVPVEYQTTSVYAVHLIWFIGLIGDSSTEKGIFEFTKEAAARGAERVRLIETETFTYWWIFPPFSFFIHPVETTIEGELEMVAVPQ